MTSDDGRLAYVRELVADAPVDPDESTTSALHRLCGIAALLTSATAAAVCLISDSGLSGVVAASDARAAAIGELQFSLGEGPSWDAFDSNRPVLAEDLESNSARGWIAWSAAVGLHSVRAAFAFPLQVGPTQVGVLDIYRSAAGALADEAMADLRALVTIATGMLLDGQERAGAGATPSGVDAALKSGFAIYQAQGMLMMQLGIPLTDAMSRLRAYAYVNDRSLSEVARDIVARTLILERDDR